MDDLVERLWGDDTHSRDYYATNDPIRLEAAAEITRLRSALETARRDAAEEAAKKVDAIADVVWKLRQQQDHKGMKTWLDANIWLLERSAFVIRSNDDGSVMERTVECIHQVHESLKEHYSAMFGPKTSAS